MIQLVFFFRRIRRTTNKEQFEETWADSLWKKIEQEISQDKNNTQPLNPWPLRWQETSFYVRMSTVVLNCWNLVAK